MKRHRSRPSLVPPSRGRQHFAIRFRLLGSDTWQEGRVEAVSAEIMVFLADVPLEVGALVEVAPAEVAPVEAALVEVAPAAGLQSLGIQLHATYARVVERVLERWPELSTAVTARFLFAPARQLPA